MSNKFTNYLINFVIIFVSVYIILSLGKTFISKINLSQTSPEIIPKAITPRPSTLGADEEATIEIFEKMSKGVVSIKNATYHRDFFSLNVYEVPQGVGSGIVWDDKGHIVTNFHVIYQADKVEVTLSNQKSFEAKLVGTAPDYDIAVLKIDIPSDNLLSIPIAHSKELKVGQKVLALGNPFGLDGTLTTGIISALGRTINSLTGYKINDVIQTDAAINPGNSGGPLLDSSGRLIGINTAIFSPAGVNAGIGFAIPSDTVNRIVSEIISSGKITKVGLGISLVPDNIKVNWSIKGAIILEVAKNSSAEKAGLQGTTKTLFGEIVLGDIITQIDSTKIESNSDLVSTLDKYKKDDSVTVYFMRNNKEYTTKATLMEL
ncbi:MAG: hypothetical protein ACD_32C00151G0002 [uncultured bacterium]|nr:MAG: hypothetical protein ACD_32C00151G0002 [uncultured bacterium]